VAQAFGLPPSRVFTSSTGVIGEPLPWERIAAAVPALRDALEPEGIEGAARAIMTTDTFPKGAAADVALPGGTVRIAGIAKGSGMIAPDMATMLVYVFTDARLGREELQRIVSAATDQTFNRITVDSDTSTSDTLLMAATGASGVDVSGEPAFAEAVERVFLDLAHQVVRDGEGATKFVEVRVTAPPTSPTPPASPWPSPTPRSSRPPSRARTRTGAASSWPSASRVPRPTATACPSASATSPWPAMRPRA
jgi:glutamate N-acetyltransferase/amino-acid N-acetyltransferase